MTQDSPLAGTAHSRSLTSGYAGHNAKLPRLPPTGHEAGTGCHASGQLVTFG